WLLVWFQFIHVGDLVRAAVAGHSPLDAQLGQPVDVANSAYAYRADQPVDQIPPESWLLLMQFANFPFDKPVDVHAPAFKPVLCGLLWEEVRPVRQVELSWPADAGRQPAPEELVLTCFDATDGAAHTWWNPRSLKQAARPEITGGGRTYV